MVRKVEKTVWVAADGSEYDSWVEATKHEQYLLAMEWINAEGADFWDGTKPCDVVIFLLEKFNIIQRTSKEIHHE